MIFFLAIHTVCKEFVPVKKYKRNNNAKLKIPIDRRILCKKQKKYERIYKQTNQTNFKENLEMILKELEVKLMKSYEMELKEREDKAVNTIKTNPKYFYTYVRQTVNPTHNLSMLKTDDAVIANLKK